MVGEARLVWARRGAEGAPPLRAWRAERVLGDGSAGRVVLARHEDEVVAAKVVGKQQAAQSEAQTAHLVAEMAVSAVAGGGGARGLVGAEYIYEDGAAVYLLLEFMGGGELFHLLAAREWLGEAEARFAAACWVLGIEALHGLGMIYHGGKTEDCLLSPAGYLKLADFGLCERAALSRSLCGTPEYVAPEVLARRAPHSKMVDFWTLGVLLFELLVGLPPFYHRDRSEMLRMILHREVDFSALARLHRLPPLAQDLLAQLLVKSPETRLGAHGFNQLKGHPWFADLDWELLAEGRLASPLARAPLAHPADTRHFDAFFTAKPLAAVLRPPPPPCALPLRARFDKLLKELQSDTTPQAS